MTRNARSAIHWKWTRGDFPTTGKHPLWPLAAALAAVAILCAPAGAASDAPPQITGASVLPQRFGVSDGTTFRYELSKKADVFFFLDRGVRGRMVGGHCHRLSRRNRHHKHCAFYVRSSSFKQAAVGG